MSLHEESVELERVLARMRSELLHLDDNYRSAADLLVRYTAGRRSLQNKAELITSGIARDLKLILRADGNTDLVVLQGGWPKTSTLRTSVWSGLLSPMTSRPGSPAMWRAFPNWYLATRG